MSLEDGTEEYYWNNAKATVHPFALMGTFLLLLCMKI